MDADGGEECFEIVDGCGLRGDFEIEGGGGAGGLVGAGGVEDCFADGDGCVLELAVAGLEVLRDGELNEDGFRGGGAVLCDAEILDVGGYVGVEVLAVGEGFEIDVGDAADAGVGCDDAAGGQVEMGEGGVGVEGRGGGVGVIDGACGAVGGVGGYVRALRG